MTRFPRNRNRRFTHAAAALLALTLATGCAKHAYFDTTGDHASPHPHRPDVGRSTPPPAAEPVRVRDAEERARMERYIAGHVDRAAVLATIQLSAQELIDCVAIDRQPALRRPALRGHTVRLQPPAEAKEDAREAETPLSGDPARSDRLAIPKAEYGADGKICPERSVPVRRLTIEILDNFATLDEFLRGRRPPHEIDGPTNLHQYANSYVFVENWGAQSTLNVWNVYTERASEFSLSQIAVVRGSGADKETLETGWQVYRDMYGDYRPRLFIFFTPDNYDSEGCYNLTCGAFVQVNNTVYIGGGFVNISAHPHPSPAWEFTVRWQRHGETGDWWLKYGDTWVGYYPSDLFDDNGLRPRGSKASFYGEIVDEQTEGRHTHTDMGSGHFPGDGFGYAAYQRRIRTITTGNVWNIRPELNADRTDADCYDIAIHSSAGDWERYFYFGGPGNNAHCR